MPPRVAAGWLVETLSSDGSYVQQGLALCACAAALVGTMGSLRRHDGECCQGLEPMDICAAGGLAQCYRRMRWSLRSLLPTVLVMLAPLYSLTSRSASALAIIY